MDLTWIIRITIKDGFKALALYREGWRIWFQSEVITKEPKTCILSFVQQGPPKVVAKRLKMAGVKMEKEHKTQISTNWLKCFVVLNHY